MHSRADDIERARVRLLSECNPIYYTGPSSDVALFCQSLNQYLEPPQLILQNRNLRLRVYLFMATPCTGFLSGHSVHLPYCVYKIEHSTAADLAARAGDHCATEEASSVVRGGGGGGAARKSYVGISMESKTKPLNHL